MLTLPSVHRVIYKPLYVLKLDYIEKNVSKTVNVMKVFFGYYIKFSTKTKKIPLFPSIS